MLFRGATLLNSLSRGPSSLGMRCFSIEVNDRMKNVKESATLKINMKVKSMREQDPNLAITHFGFGQSPFPVPEPVQQALRDHAHEKDYLPTRGLPRLCDSIATYYQKHFGLSQFNSENVFVGPGSKELIYHLLYLMDGDLLLPSPSWVSYGPQAQLVGKSVRSVESIGEQGYRITGETLERACEYDEEKKQKILILNSPNNPTGASYPAEELEKIANVCEKNNVVAISDEIYANINFTNADSANIHTSLAKFYPSKTIVTGGLSKLFAAGGYRFGCALIPGEKFEQRVRDGRRGEGFVDVWEGLRVVISETYSCVSAPIQWAALKAYEDYEEISPYLEKCNHVHEVAGLYLHQRFEKMGLFCPQPGGAFYLFPSFGPYEKQLNSHGVHNSEQLANFLLEEAHVAALPSADFNHPSSLSLRVASVDYEGGEIVKHLEGGGQLTTKEEDVKKWMPRLVSGCDRLEKLLKGL